MVAGGGNGRCRRGASRRCFSGPCAAGHAGSDGVRHTEADQCRRPGGRLRGGGTGERSARVAAPRLALRHPHLCRRGAAPRRRRLQGDRSLSARLWHDAISFCRDAAQRPAGGTGRRCHRPDGCAETGECDRRWLRLGCPHRGHPGRGLAGALPGTGLGERLSDRQPGGEPQSAAAQGRTAMVVPVLLCDRARARRDTASTRATSPG